MFASLLLFCMFESFFYIIVLLLFDLIVQTLELSKSNEALKGTL